MKLILKIAAGVFLGIGAILLVRTIPSWYEQAGTKNIKLREQLAELGSQVARQHDAVTREILEKEDQIRALETPAQRKREQDFAKRLANMTPNQLIAACGKPDKITVKKEAEDTLRTLEYDGYIEMSFRYPNESDIAPYLGSTGDITSHTIGSWAWGQELTAELPCVKKLAGSKH